MAFVSKCAVAVGTASLAAAGTRNFPRDGEIEIDVEVEAESPSCPCNSSYVSKACCDSGSDGLVWEPAENWMGYLV
jgi:hypothetical protein